MMTIMASSLSCSLTSTATSKPASLIPSKPDHQAPSCTDASAIRMTGRREAALSLATAAGMLACSSVAAAIASEDDDYVRETNQVISKVRSTINMDRTDPNVATAVAELREASNTWVAKYRREKALLGRSSFRDVYSALNAVSGHYISFGPTAPIPAKRRARILEEVDTAEKALLRGR